jgi:polysaccharide export outer membrane protein
MVHDSESKMTETTPATFALAAVLCGLALGIAGCTSVGRDLPPPEQVYAPLQGPIDRAEYRIQVGDRLNIKFPYHKRSNQELPVRPDGKITLEVTGELGVEGLTAHELEELIKQRSAHRLRDPEVVVMVTSFGDRRVYVGGEVARAGFITIQEGMTPLQAVLAAGGFKDSAQRDSVLYVTRASTGEYKATRVDLDDVVKNGTPERVRLAGNDVVFVPASRIANANIFVRQYIRDMLPVDSRAGATAALPGF